MSSIKRKKNPSKTKLMVVKEQESGWNDSTVGIIPKYNKLLNIILNKRRQFYKVN